jgi:hypothetical protein
MAAATITKTEAVRRALQQLGRDAKPTQMQGHIKERFGFDMTTDHISTCKGAQAPAIALEDVLAVKALPAATELVRGDQRGARPAEGPREA